MKVYENGTDSYIVIGYLGEIYDLCERENYERNPPLHIGKGVFEAYCWKQREPVKVVDLIQQA